MQFEAMNPSGFLLQDNGPQVGRGMQKTKVHGASSRDAPVRPLIDEPRLGLLGASWAQAAYAVGGPRLVGPSLGVHSAHAVGRVRMT